MVRRCYVHQYPQDFGRPAIAHPCLPLSTAPRDPSWWPGINQEGEVPREPMGNGEHLPNEPGDAPTGEV